MKNLMIIIGVMLLWACNPGKQQQGEEEVKGPADGMSAFHDSEEHANQMVASLNVDENFLKQLYEVYRKNLDLKDALVDSDLKKAQSEAAEVIEKLGTVDHQLLKGDAHGIWMASLREIAHLLSNIKQAEDLETQRENFALMNRALYRSLKFLGYSGEPIYYQYCPMAFNDQGAYWLSSTREIRNPYFGDKMMKCGETKEVLQ